MSAGSHQPPAVRCGVMDLNLNSKSDQTPELTIPPLDYTTISPPRPYMGLFAYTIYLIPVS